MAIRNIGSYSGNRYSLRSKPLDQVRRIGALANLRTVGDILVTTSNNIIMGFIVIGVAAGIMIILVAKNGFATLLQNLFPAFLVIVGTVLIAFNAMLTNPSFGSQLTVSLKYLFKKFNDPKGKKKPEQRDIFGFYDDGTESIIETIVKGKIVYLAIYRVRGVASPVSFPTELEFYATLDRQLLLNMEKDDSILGTINTIDAAKTRPKKLPRNATPEMIRRRNLNHRIVNDLKQNKQLKSLVTISSRTLDGLRVKVDSAENVFNQGLVIGYERLNGKKAKKEFREIYGELR